jgi:trk system potassium uptake protein TrkH
MWNYLGIIAAAIILICFNILPGYANPLIALRDAAFQVGSIITTTGFSTVDFDLWPAFSKTILVTLMFIGACAGSTGGGFKVSRVLILLKEVRKEFRLIVHPRTVETVKVNGKKVSHEVTRNASVYLIIYIMFVVISTALIAFDGFDFTTNLTSVLATFNNTGPGFSIVGSAGNYSSFSVFSKIVFIFNMLAGRLELYPMLLIFMPRAWKKN